jgi:ABC-2 type transport system ATP-binding protein
MDTRGARDKASGDGDVTTSSSVEPSEPTNETGRAVADALAVGAAVVVGYIGADGFPRQSSPASVRADGRSVLVLWPGDGERDVASALVANPRVSLFVEDPRAATRYRLSGKARVGPDEVRGERALDGTAAPVSGATELPDGSIVIDVMRVEVTGPDQSTVLERPAEVRTSPTLGAPILDVASLSIYYGATRAVNGLSLQVLHGEIFGLLGPNGAGKTSTLSAIEGLLRPRSGKVTLDGIDVLRRPIDARARMGVQLQATSFQASLSIKEIVRLYGGLYGVVMSEPAIAATLGAIGLEADMGKQFKQLSGGQQQRLSLQIAVIHEPTLLLLDEPTAGLDPQARRQLWGRIEHIRQSGGSILLTTHSMEEAQAVCDRVAIMDHGEILTCGSPQELIALHRNDPNVRAVAHGEVTLDDVFVGMTGTAIRE